ncbi:MAG: hypothetical protein AB8H80_19205 [Planctomycetota bacterium]
MTSRFASSRIAGLVALLLCMPAACIKERRYLVMHELSALASPNDEQQTVLVGDVEGEANYRQVLTLFAISNLQGTQGTLLTSAGHALLEDRASIPVLDKVLGRISAILNGSTRIATAQRVALGRAMHAAQELGADTLLAPQFEITTRSLTFGVPLGWLYSSGSVEVRAKAVRLGPAPVAQNTETNAATRFAASVAARAANQDR